MSDAENTARLDMKTVFWRGNLLMSAFRVALLAGIFLPIIGCSNNSNSNTMNVDENLTTTEVIAETSSAPPIPPKVHLYAINDGDKYGYVAAVSEEDKKQGKAAGDVVLFSYRGHEGE